MHLIPYVCVDETPFTITPAEVRARWGRPIADGRNAVALNELDYGRIVFRFQDSGRLEEVTQEAPVLHLVPDGVAVPFAALHGFVHTQDPGAFQRGGYLISPRYGLAFVPDEPCWVTALARHCIETWRALSPPPD